MNDEILKLRGRLTIAENLARSRELGIAFDIDELRALADRHIEDKAGLQTDRILIVARRLDDQVHALRQARDQIRALREDLGQ